MSGFEDRLAEVFRETFGLSESAARVAARGRNPAPLDDPFDEFVESFRRQGLSPAAAKRAAIGRSGSEHAARQFLGSRPSAGGTSLDEGSEELTGPAAHAVTLEAKADWAYWNARREAATTAEELAEANAGCRAAADLVLRHARDRDFDPAVAKPKGKPSKPTESRRSTGQRAKRATLNEPRPGRG